MPIKEMCVFWNDRTILKMNIYEATREAYLKTLSPTEAENFKNIPKEEQTKILSLFIEWGQKEFIPSLKTPRPHSILQQPIKMTGDAPIGQIGDEVSFTSTTSVAAQPTSQPLLSSIKKEDTVPTYPPEREKLVQRYLRSIDRGMNGFYDTAQNVQIAIDRALEGDLYPEDIREFMIYKLQEKMKEFPEDEVAAATNPERRAELSAARQINTAILNKLKEAYNAADDEIRKGNKKAGFIDHLGHGINTLWLDKEDTRQTAAERLMSAQEAITQLNGLKYKLTAEEFAAEFRRLTGEKFDFNQIVNDFQAGEAAASGMGKTYVIGGVAIAISGGLAGGAVTAAVASAKAGGAVGATAITKAVVTGLVSKGATTATSVTVAGIAKGAAIGAGTGAAVGGSANIATDTVNKLTNKTDNSEDFSREGLTEMAKNAGAAAAMGAVSGAAGGAIAGTLMGTTLSTGAKIGLDVAGNTVIGAVIDYATTGEITLEGTLMNASTSTLSGISAYRVLKGAAQIDVPSTRIIGESIGDPKMNITKVTDYDAAVSAARQSVDGADLKVAVAGYSAAPNGYEIKTAAFLNELVDSGDKGKTALITSPTASKGSIDAIATNVAQAHDAPITYLTAEGYVKYINPEEFPTTIDITKFNNTQKYAFQNGADYSKASADVSNSLIITGGRDVSVLDFKNAIDAGNPVVLLKNNDLGESNFDAAKSRPNNAVAYIENMIADPTGVNQHTKHVAPQWWIDNADKLKNLVKVVDIDSPTAVQEAKSFLAQRKELNAPTTQRSVNNTAMLQTAAEKMYTLAESVKPQADAISRGIGERAGVDISDTSAYSSRVKGTGNLASLENKILREINSQSDGVLTSCITKGDTKGAMSRIYDMYGARLNTSSQAQIDKIFTEIITSIENGELKPTYVANYHGDGCAPIFSPEQMKQLKNLCDKLQIEPPPVFRTDARSDGYTGLNFTSQIPSASDIHMELQIRPKAINQIANNVSHYSYDVFNGKDIISSLPTGKQKILLPLVKELRKIKSDNALLNRYNQYMTECYSVARNDGTAFPSATKYGLPDIVSVANILKIDKLLHE